MKKVYLIHGYKGSPNGGWRPWLMGELDTLDIFACALQMPSPDLPLRTAWVEEIGRQIALSGSDEVYLVGHSLGGPAILHYLESLPQTNQIKGVVLVSSPAEPITSKKITGFLQDPLDFAHIRSHGAPFVVIHGDDDPNVPFSNAEMLAEQLLGTLVRIPNGGHLNGSSGFTQLPQCLDALKGMFGMPNRN